MTFKVSDNQYGRPHPSDSWASCYHCVSKRDPDIIDRNL